MFLGCFASCAYIYYWNLELGISQPPRQPYGIRRAFTYGKLNMCGEFDEAFDSLIPEMQRAFDEIFEDDSEDDQEDEDY